MTESHPLNTIPDLRDGSSDALLDQLGTSTTQQPKSGVFGSFPASGGFQPPYTNRGVQIPDPSNLTTSSSVFLANLDAQGAAFFDWYQATVPVSPDALRSSFIAHFGGEFEDSGPVKNYTNGVIHSSLSFRIYWGGHNPHPNIVATSSDSPAIASWLRSAFPDHRISRVDVAYDFSFSQSFDSLAAILEPIARKRNVSIKLLGDPAENNPDYPEEKRRGRTLYLGSRTSELRIRLYEKGFERRCAGNKDIDPNLTRLEIVATPQKARKSIAATLSPFEIIGLSKWISGAVNNIVGSHAPTIPQNIKRDTSTDERLEQCVRQYGRTLREVVDQKGWNSLLESLSILLYNYEDSKRLIPIIKEQS